MHRRHGADDRGSQFEELFAREGDRLEFQSGEHIRQRDAIGGGAENRD
jgi:hypothetical protein